MKKILLGLIVCALLFSFSPVAKATTLSQQDLRNQLIQLIIQQIQVLREQLQVVLAQEAAQVQPNVQQQSQVIQQSPIPTVSSVSSSTPQLTPSAVSTPQYSIKISENVYSLYQYGNRNDHLTNSDLMATKGVDLVVITAQVYDSNNNWLRDKLITVTTDDPDMPSTFFINGQGFYIGDHHQSRIIQDTNNVTSCSYEPHMPQGYNDGCIPVSVGVFNFTFTQPELNISQSIKLTVAQ